MSVSSVSSSGFDQLVPVLPSENAVTAAAARREEAARTAGAGSPPKEMGMFEEDGPSFADLLDVINPLQHIPIVNSIYRELTGDQIGVGPRLLGGLLFGGPIGVVAAAANSVTEAATGHDLGGHVIALFKDDAPAGAAPPTAVAAAQPPPVQPPPTQAPAAQAPVESGDAQAVILPELAAAPAPAPAPVQPAPAEQVAQAPLAQAPPAQAEATSMRPVPGREARMMAAPGRNTAAVPKQLANVTVPLSNSSARTNVPVTGMRTTSGAVNPMLVQQMVAAQAQAGRGGTVAAPGVGVPQGQEAWFSGAMLQALDKYERSAKLGQQAATTAPAAIVPPPQ